MDTAAAKLAFARLWNAGYFREFVETSDDVVVVVDVDGTIAYANPAAERLFGRSVGELAGQRVFSFIHPDDRRRTAATFRNWLAKDGKGATSLENRFPDPEGGTRTILWTVQPCYGPTGRLLGFASTGRDITLLQEQRRTLERREAHYRAVLAGMLDAVVTIDAYGEVIDASDSVQEVFGWRPDELRGQNVRVLMPEPHRSKHDDYLAAYRRTGETWILGSTREFPCVRKDETIIDCELSVSRVDVPGTDVPVFCGSFRDITQRRHAERALSESERRFRAIFEQEFQFVGLLQPDGRVLEANQAALHAARVGLDDVLGRPFWEVPWWSGEDARERVRQAVQEAAAGQFVRLEIALDNPERGLRTIDFSLKPLLDASGAVTLLLPEGRDITEIKRAQERETAMLRAFATIGESASVLAHEIKNPITAVNLALRAVAEKLGEDHRAILEGLVGSLRKVELLMRRTLSFTRPLDPQYSRCSVPGLIETALAESAALAEEAGVTLGSDIASDCGDISADNMLVGQVLTNLIQNAIQAVDEGGRVVAWCRAEEGGVRFGVDDDGPGIPEALREEVLRPFVTTRAGGTGLGLALTRKVIEGHGGRIEVTDAPLGGARMDCFLPNGSPLPRV